MSAICWCHSVKTSLSRLVAATFQAKLNLAWLVAATFQAKLNLSWKVAATNRDKLRIQWNKQVFGRFYEVFVPFSASGESLCTWHGYFKKTSVRACFFWLQRPLIQSSAAPQGSPPPTQQIKIQMQISWVGWSTRSDLKVKYVLFCIFLYFVFCMLWWVRRHVLGPYTATSLQILKRLL